MRQRSEQVAAEQVLFRPRGGRALRILLYQHPCLSGAPKVQQRLQMRPEPQAARFALVPRDHLAYFVGIPARPYRHYLRPARPLARTWWKASHH